MLAKAGEAYGAPEIRDLSAVLVGLNTASPSSHHRAPQVLKIAPELMQYATVKHVVFGIHDFSKAMGIHITPRHWTEELKFYLHDILFEARIAGKGVIGGVETLIGQSTMRRTSSSPTTCAAGSTCTATRSRASSTSTPARRPRWAFPASR